jgi:glycosyltransferase involved in cell wall biosynthesis
MAKQNQIDVVHAHMARDYSLAAYAARGNPRSKFIVTRHVLFPLNRIHKRTLARATKVIAVSTAVARQISNQRIVSEERIALVPNGIEVDRFANACESFDRAAFLNAKGLPLDCVLIASIGELRTLKRHDDLIRAAAIVSREIKQAHFVIAGVDTSPSGENRSELMDLVNELKLADQVHLLGWLDDAEKLLCATDVFVSASETESFGLSIAEAMAAGTAVIATMTDGAQEVVEDQVTGLLVPIGDVKKMAVAILGLLKNEEHRKALGKRAAESARLRFGLSRMVDEIERIYLEN